MEPANYDFYDPGPDTAELHARQGRLFDHLARGDLGNALAEVDSWTSWPLDLIGRWLVIETYFQSQRRDFVPVLKRMLRDGIEPNKAHVAQMEAMIEQANSWPAKGER